MSPRALFTEILISTYYLRGFQPHYSPLLALTRTRRIPEKRINFSIEKKAEKVRQKNFQRHSKSKKSRKFYLGTHPGSVSGWGQRRIGLQNRPERLRCAFCAVNTMLLAHCTKSIRGHFLVHVCCLSTSFEHGFGPQNRTQPEKVDSKKYDKIKLKNDPKKALKWPPTPDPRTVFLMYFSLLYPSWGPCRSQGRHKGAEATKMMPELPQRVHKLV